MPKLSRNKISSLLTRFPLSFGRAALVLLKSLGAQCARLQVMSRNIRYIATPKVKNQNKLYQVKDTHDILECC